MKKYVKYFQTKDHSIEDVLKWVKGNIPVNIMSGITPTKEIGTQSWKVEWYDND